MEAHKSKSNSGGSDTGNQQKKKFSLPRIELLDIKDTFGKAVTTQPTEATPTNAPS